jgi:hypothetical protein
MIEFHAPAHDAPELLLSPVYRASLLTLRHLAETGPIGLTPSKALKRYFVTLAADEFNWPDYTASDLYALNKVLNEQDFPPLVVLHDLLLATKLARHRKGFLHITKMGKDLLEHSGSLWLLLAQHFLLTAGHDDYLDVEWVSVLKALNFAADAWITDKDFCSHLLSMDEKDYRLKSLAYVHVLRPLCWLGLLHETRDKQSERHFTKTALWSLALTFEDAALPSVMKH